MGRSAYAGERKATGIANPIRAAPAEPVPPPVTVVIDLPPAEADGAKDEAARRARPARGRGTGRVASAAATGPRDRRVAPEPVYPLARGCRSAARGLDELTQVRRPRVIARIASARELGDLKENSEYHAAREEQSFLEGRVKSLEATLRHAVIVAPEARGATVILGSRVRVEVDGEETTFTLVGSAEGRYRQPVGCRTPIRSAARWWDGASATP